MVERQADPGSLPSVLVVEDDGPTRTLLEREIGDAGYPVRGVPDSRSALAAIELDPPGIVLADIHLPGGMSGTQLCAAVRKARPGTEVILVTAFGSIETAIEGVKLGACDYLVKPFREIADVSRSLAKAAARISERLTAREAMAALEATVEGQAALLDRLPIAIVLVDGGLRVQGRNRAAELILAERSGLRLDDDGRLRCLRPKDEQALREAVAACHVGGGEGSATVAIGREGGRPALCAVVASLRAPGRGDRPRAALVLHARERTSLAPQAEILSRLYGLTPAEGMLAARLVAGESVQEACDALGIALATGRTHLSRIFSKTGTTRQGDLIGLVLSGPALLAAGVVPCEA